MTISLILTAFLFDFPIMQYQTYNQDGAMKGGEGIVYEKEQYSELSVTLTEEYITATFSPGNGCHSMPPYTWVCKVIFPFVLLAYYFWK